MKSALLILGTYSLVYAGATWFVAFTDEERLLRQASRNSGWVTIYPATRRDRFSRPRRAAPAKDDLRFSVVDAVENKRAAELE